MAGNNILSIDKTAVYDDTIIKKEIYPYTPYTTAFGESDEIRIAIQSKDSYLLPSESYIYMQIRATSTGATAANDPDVKFINNYASFLFSDVRYELNGVEIDRVRNVGRATTMKLMVASRFSHLKGYANYCKTYEEVSPYKADAPRTKVYDVVIPLSVWFGFCDDYRKIILNSKHELILNRARNSRDCTKGGGEAATAATVDIALLKIEWKMPHVILSDRIKLNMLNYLAKNRKMVIQHRSMDMMEYPALPASTSQIWAVKTVSHANRPRYVVVGFQTSRNGVRTADAAKFDTCNIQEVRLHMNSQIYPYNMSELDIGGSLYSELYHYYASIQSSYYSGVEISNPFHVSYGPFQNTPLFVFDTSRTDESLIDSSVDIRIEIKAREAIAANTAAYCLIIYDNEFTYSPFDSIVTRKI
ncbi:uncharacterized protein LOC129570439 [Sitodiplosis mosellana]|uniref:uncharacterized protein LOC129570439 n=1 Tax=Sitodiplosis mosellana TaxID=263140 RepID=UPI002444B12C|nr:uncharacterized protein LOC129570439 [Sitodiplosis mosellana]